MEDIKRGSGLAKVDNQNKGGCVERTLKREVALHKGGLLVISDDTSEKA